MRLRAWPVVGTAIALALTGAAPASAAVEIGPQRISVSSAAGRAVIARSPFRLSFVDAGGRVVLRQLGSRPRRARRLAPTLDPEPLSLERLPTTPPMRR